MSWPSEPTYELKLFDSADPCRNHSGGNLVIGNSPLEAIQRILLVKRAQNLGFNLEEISQLLALLDGQEAGCEDVKQFALEKVREIETTIAHFMGLKQILLYLVGKCQGGELLIVKGETFHTRVP